MTSVMAQLSQSGQRFALMRGQPMTMLLGSTSQRKEMAQVIQLVPCSLETVTNKLRIIKELRMSRMTLRLMSLKTEIPTIGSLSLTVILKTTKMLMLGLPFQLDIPW